MRITTLYITVMLLLPPLLLGAQVRKDHVLHFGAGIVSGGAGALVASELSDGNRFWTFTGAVGTSLLAGVAKEVLDKGKGKKWENSDIGATVLGGITIGVTIDLFTAKARKRRKGVTAKHDFPDFGEAPMQD
jgi:hypothetical protein